MNPPCWASRTVVGLNLTIPRNCLSALAGERLATISHSMYRLERTGLAWILDAPDPSSSFPSLKQHEMKQFGEYRTQRYALRTFDQLERGEVPNLIGSPSGRALTRPFRSRPVEQRGPT